MIEGLDRLVADLTAAPQRLQRRAAVTVERGAHNVKSSAQQFASGLAHAPLYPRSITYDTGFEIATGTLWADVGPDKDLPQGALGNILEYGSVKNGPVAHLGPALDLEGPGFEGALAHDASEALG